MSNDVGLKTRVSEQTHNDFPLLIRAYGFRSKSELLRYLVERELYSVVPHPSDCGPQVLDQQGRRRTDYGPPVALDTGKKTRSAWAHH